MDIREAFDKYKSDNELIAKYNYALFIMSFDQETDCPENDKEYSLSVQEFFHEKSLDIYMSDDYQKNLKYLFDNKNLLTDFERAQIEEDYKEIDKLNKIPHDELIQHYKNVNKCGLLWKRMRETKDYNAFLNELKELVNYNFKYIDWMKKPYDNPLDILLDEMEDGFSVKKYDEFFNLIKKEIVPLAKKIVKIPKKYNPKLDTLKFDKYKQMKITREICDMMGYTQDKGCVRETLHPFTNGINSNDVRITTAYDESLLLSNIYSVMHEAGHALYELGQDPKLNGTSLFGGTSMGIHESQSRFMENYLGRSYAFTKKLYSIISKEFPQEFKDITVDDLYYYANYVSDQFKRTEADELTYPIHILIRYEVEKDLFNKRISVDQISDRFNELFYEYLGKTPRDMIEGAFQDVHWSSGFGYFPTYALGNAYAAQFMHTMEKTLDFDTLMENGDFKSINKWLDENIHKYGKSKKNLEIVKLATGEDFNPKYYIDYLKNKFEKIYNIK
jgi:carboxypeptidase Taq